VVKKNSIYRFLREVPKYMKSAYISLIYDVDKTVSDHQQRAMSPHVTDYDDSRDNERCELRGISLQLGFCAVWRLTHQSDSDI